MAEGPETATAIYDAILSTLQEAELYHGPVRAAMVREAAVAYRAVQGGVQPAAGPGWVPTGDVTT